MSSSEEEEYKEAAVVPLEIEIEILKRLPDKSLMKFMSVSKSWNSIIRSSTFIADHNLNSTHVHLSNRLFVGYKCRNYVDIFENDYDYNGNGFHERLTVPISADHPADLIFIGYSQGLFGIHRSGTILNDKYVPSVVIWNPSIRKSVFVPLPEPGYNEYNELFFTVCNADDPTTFKITHRDIPRLQVQIFRLSTRAWRTVFDTPRESIKVTERMVGMDRFIYWIAYRNDDLNNNLILSFDITREQFTELCLPPTSDPNPYYLTLALSKFKESLVVIEYMSYEQIRLWMMMESGVQNSYTELFTIKLRPDTSIQLPNQNVLGFTKDGQLIILLDLYCYPSKRTLHLYEPASKCLKKTGIFGEWTSHHAGSYRETLLLLDHPDSVCCPFKKQGYSDDNE